MLLVEENHMGTSTSTHADNKMLCTEEDRPCGGGGRGGLAPKPKARRWCRHQFQTLGEQGDSRQRRKLASKELNEMMVLWQERSLRKQVLEEARRFGQIRIRIRQNRTRKSVVVALSSAWAHFFGSSPCVHL